MIVIYYDNYIIRPVVNHLPPSNLVLPPPRSSAVPASQPEATSHGVDPFAPPDPAKAGQVSTQKFTRPLSQSQADALMPMLADQWVTLISKVISTHEDAASAFQIDSAGMTRRFETIIRDLDASGTDGKTRRSAAPALHARSASAEGAESDAESVQARGHLLERMNVALQTLGTRTSQHAQNLTAAMREITEVAGKGLGVSRASVWVLVENDSILRCLDLYEHGANKHSNEKDLATAGFPSYFASLKSCRVIDAHIAQKDPRTFEFAKDYLGPRGITSLLDAPIRRDGHLIGVISLEHVGQARKWTSEEIAFAGSLADMIALIVESSERHRAEAEVKRSHSLLRAAFNATADGIVVVDLALNVSGYNQRFLEMWRVTPEQLATQNPAELVNIFADQTIDPEKFRENTAALFTSPGIETSEVIECKDGRVFERISKPQRLDNEIVGRVCCYSDITEKTKSEESSQSMERMLQQTQKLEALGTLAGGIAHDFNNILTAVLGHSELAMLQTDDANVKSSLGEILKASERAKHLVKQILTFCRQRPPERKVQKIRPLLDEVLKLLKATLPANIEIKQDFDPTQSSACIDPVQFHQVLMNLCTNASHAMKETGGVLRIGEALIDISPAGAATYPDLKPGPHAHLWVCDSGCGMDRETVRRIFEPFFTTKPVGEGTGLGLSVVHGIIRAHDGTITVESEVGRGTTFHIYIPAVRDAAGGPEKVESKESTRGHGERIMYVDDEASVCQFVKQALEMLGYIVHTYIHPVEALEHFRTKGKDYNLIITDMGMPRVNGLDLSQRIQKMQPGIPIILMSGNDGGVPHATLAQAGIKRVVTKPVSCRDLSLAVNEVLEMHRTGIEVAPEQLP